MEKDKLKILEAITKYDAAKEIEMKYEKKKSFWKGITVAMLIQLVVYVWFKVF